MNHAFLLRAIITLLLSLSALLAQNDNPLPPAVPRARSSDELARQTVVVFNKLDIESTALAGFYAEKRGIPLANLIGIPCAKDETITRDQYDRTIATPIREAFEERGWWKLRPSATEAGRVEKTSMRFLVLMRGIPLRIVHEGNYAGDDPSREPAEIFNRNESSVDSDLAALGVWSRQISGVLVNPYFRETRTIEETDLHSQLLVCRLDAPSAATVRRLINDALATEATGLRGFAYIDAQGLTEKNGGMAEGDAWLRNSARALREKGIPVILDDGPALFPQPYPMRHVAYYFGWYSENLAGPFTTPGFKLVPGSIATHIHSFSAITLRETSRGWCAPLLEAGAAATLGNVFEPYLGLTPQLDIFAQRLLEGFTFAEAAYMSQRFLSWMTTFVGDPLYRPLLHAKMAGPDPFNAYRGAVATWLKSGRPAGEAAMKHASQQLKRGELSESHGLLQLAGNEFAAAIAAFQQARAEYESPEDRARVAIHESGAIRALKGPAESAAFLRKQALANRTANASALLDFLANSSTAQPVQKSPPKPKKP